MAYATFNSATAYEYLAAATQDIYVPAMVADEAAFLFCRSAVTISTPSGFTRHTATSGADGTYVFYRKATGTEAETVATVTMGSSAKLMVIVAHYSNVDVIYPTSAQTISQDGDPPELAPGVGAADFQAIAFSSNRNTYSSSIYCSAAPDGYTGFLAATNAATSGGVAHVAIARKSVNAETEDPGAFTWQGSPTALRSVSIAFSGLVSITLDAPGKIQSGKALTLTGTGFGAAKGTGSVLISPTNSAEDGDAVENTVSTWSDTSLPIAEVGLPTGKVAGDTVYIFVTNDDGDLIGSGAVLVADPTLRVGILRDTDADSLIVLDPIEVIVLAGGTGAWDVELDLTDEVVPASGIIEIDNALYTIDELADTKLVVAIGSATRASVPVPAVVVDRNDD